MPPDQPMAAAVVRERQFLNISRNSANETVADCGNKGAISSEVAFFLSLGLFVKDELASWRSDIRIHEIAVLHQAPGKTVFNCVGQFAADPLSASNKNLLA